MASVSTASWRERLTKRWSGGGDRESDKAKRQGGKEERLISHLPAASEDWLVIEMETAFTNGTDRVDGPGIAKRRASANSRNAVSSPSPSGKGSVRNPRPPLRATSPNSGPSAHHRKTSAPATRVGGGAGGHGQRLEVQNGRSSPRSASPHRSIMVKKKSSTGSSPGQSLAVVGEVPHGPEAPADDGTVSPDMSNFSKVRDTLRIKGVKKKKGGAYSVPHAPPELTFDHQVASKYDDPFESPPNFMDSTEERRPGQDHSFEWVSVPHNKPEYCDHCGETAWGFHRQVMKCSSEWRLEA